MRNRIVAKTISELPILSKEDRWLVDGIIPVGTTCVAGMPKTKKTFWCLSLCLGLATQKAFLGKWNVPRARRVIYIAGEGEGVIGERLRGLARGHGIGESDLSNLFVVTGEQLSLTSAADRQRLREVVVETKAEVVCLDPWARFLCGASESSTEQMAEILGFLKSLQDELGVSWIIVHHLRKATRAKPTGADLRGSGQLHSWVDCTVLLRNRDNQILMDVESRHSEGVADVPLMLYSSSGGAFCFRATSDDLRPMTSENGKRIFRCRLIAIHGKVAA
jgi:RecA-family ATPase